MFNQENRFILIHQAEMKSPASRKRVTSLGNQLTSRLINERFRSRIFIVSRPELAARKFVLFQFRFRLLFWCYRADAEFYLHAFSQRTSYLNHISKCLYRSKGKRKYDICRSRIIICSSYHQQLNLFFAFTSAWLLSTLFCIFNHSLFLATILNHKTEKVGERSTLTQAHWKQHEKHANCIFNVNTNSLRFMTHDLWTFLKRSQIFSSDVAERRGSERKLVVRA